MESARKVYSSAMAVGSSVRTEVLVVSFLLSFHVQQTVACPEPGHAHRAGGLSVRLTVENQEEATEVPRAQPFGPRIPNGPRRAWRNKEKTMTAAEPTFLSSCVPVHR